MILRVLKTIAFIVISFFSQIKAQTTVSNLDMEQWILSASGRYENPAPASVWATPNYIMDLISGNPSTAIVQKSSDKHGGNYAALMKTRTILGNLAGATLFTGALNTSNPISPVAKLGIPFTGKPQAMTGWYKYTSVNNDSSSIYILLTKWNTTSNSRIRVGFAEQRDYTSVNAYTAFNLPINYYTADTPDSITIVFSASAGAEFNRGQVGSSLWIDDVVLAYSTGFLQPIMAENNLKIYPNPAKDYIQIQASEKSAINLALFDSKGAKLLTLQNISNQEKINIQNLKSGTYTVQIFYENSLFGSQTFVKQ